MGFALALQTPTGGVHARPAVAFINEVSNSGPTRQSAPRILHDAHESPHSMPRVYVDSLHGESIRILRAGLPRIHIAVHIDNTWLIIAGREDRHIVDSEAPSRAWDDDNQ